jgi:hypothetical protein
LAQLGWPQLPDGQLPWAALGQEPAGQAFGWVTLCHWAMGREQATLSDPQWLQVRPQECEALLEDMRPFFQSEGIELQAMAADRWLACGPALDLPCAALDRVVGRDVDPWLPAGVHGRLLRRLQDPPKGGTAVDFRTWGTGRLRRCSSFMSGPLSFRGINSLGTRSL